MSEAAVVAECFVQGFYDFEASPINLLKNQLGDTISATNRVRLVAPIDHTDLYFAPVVRIDCARAVYDPDPVRKGQSASRPHLNLKILRDGKSDTCRDNSHCTGLKLHFALECTADVHPGRMGSHISGYGEIRIPLRIEATDPNGGVRRGI